MATIGPRLIKVLEMVREDAPVPVLITLREMPTAEALDELHAAGLGSVKTAKFTPTVTGVITANRVQQLADLGIVVEVVYDEPIYVQ